MIFAARWFRIPALAAFVAGFLAACSPGGPSPTESTQQPNQQSPSVASDDVPVATFADVWALRRVLLKTEEVAPLIGSKPEMLGSDYYKVFVPEAGAVISNPGCTSALTPGMNTTFAPTNYQFATGNRVTDGDVQGFDATRNATQMLLSYPGVADARAAVDAARPLWQACEAVAMTRVDKDGDTIVTTMGRPTDTEAGLTVLNIAEGGDGWRCARSLGSHSSVVVDIMVCGAEATTDQAIAVQEAIFKKIKV